MICLLMSVALLSNIRMYWETKLGLPVVRATVTLNRFDKISCSLLLNDNSLQGPSDKPGHNRFHKIRPVLEILRDKCQKIPKREALSVDTNKCVSLKLLTYCDSAFLISLINVIINSLYCAMIRYWRMSLRYTPKWRITLSWGKDTSAQGYSRSGDKPDLGASGNTVVRLARSITLVRWCGTTTTYAVLSSSFVRK